MTITQMQEALDQGLVTSVDLVNRALARAEDVKDKNAIGVLSPLALERAKKMDAERKAGRVRGPLHGIPMVIKDNILYQDGTPTTANSYAFRDLMPPYNAEIVERLLKAGAVIIGKANLSELANFLTREGMPNGYGSMYGQVKHPYDESVDPLGSSTGSAVAVALDIVPGSVGSETNGSLMAPAMFNQVVTLKPTNGLVPQHGIIPISPSQDTAGPFAKTVEDVAILMDALTDQPGTFTKDLDKPVKGKILWVDIHHKESYLPEAWKEEMKQRSISRFQAMGLQVDEIQMEEPQIDNETLLLTEFAPAMNSFLSTLEGYRLQSMEDVIEEYKKHKKRAMKYGISLLTDSLTYAKPLDDPEYLALVKQQQEEARFAQDKIKEGYLAIACAGWTDWAPIHGNPSVNIPEPEWKEFPRGTTLVGGLDQDAQLLNLAYLYQKQF
jgi:amidase